MRFMGGGSGAGKGSLQKQGKIVLRKGSVVIDSDEAKLFLPEYKTMVDSKNEFAAAFAHEESSYLGKRAMSESIESSFDTMLDGTGNSSIEKMTGKVNAARKQGAKRVVADYVTIDTDEAIRRATARAERTGRKVPLDTITGTHESVSAVFPQAAKNELFDELRLWDNMGDSPRLIFQQIDGVTEILDPEAYARFLAKSPLDEGFRATQTPVVPAKTVKAEFVPDGPTPAKRRPKLTDQPTISGNDLTEVSLPTRSASIDNVVEARKAKVSVDPTVMDDFSILNRSWNAEARAGRISPGLDEIMKAAETTKLNGPTTVYRGINEQVAEELMKNAPVGSVINAGEGATFASAWPDYAVLYGDNEMGKSFMLELVTDRGLAMPVTLNDEMALVVSGRQQFEIVGIRNEVQSVPYSSRTLDVTIFSARQV